MHIEGWWHDSYFSITIKYVTISKTQSFTMKDKSTNLRGTLIRQHCLKKNKHQELTVIFNDFHFCHKVQRLIEWRPQRPCEFSFEKLKIHW